MKKHWVQAAIAAAALVVIVIVVIPFFVNADTFRPKIQDELSSALGRKVTLGHISLSLFTGSLVAENISIADDPAFSSAPFLQAKELRIGVELGPLIFQHSIQITTFTVDTPSIQLIHAANGTWNFSSLGSSTSQPSAQQTGAPPSLTVNELKIENGSAALSSVPVAGNPFTCTDVNLTVRQLSFTQSFPFELSLKTAGGGSLSLSGTAGPVAQKDTSLTPFQATLDIKHFDPLAAGAVQPSDGISMVADFNAQVASKDGNLTTTGKATASQLKLARNGTPAPKPVDVNFSLSDNLSSRTGQVNDLAIQTGSVAVHIAGTFRHDGDEAVLNLHLSAPNLPVDQVEQLLPAAGVTLPSGSRLEGGTLTASLAITGPANALTISGPIELDNSQLMGFDLGSKIQGINPISGTSNGTEIQKLRADVNNSPQGTRFSNIDAEVPKIGSATGEGTVSPSEELNFQLNAKIAALSAVGGVVNNGVGAVGGLFGKNSKSESNSGGIPLTITGTASNPSIHAQMGKMLKQAANGIVNNSTAQKPVKSLKGLFGK
ncbi:MAG TPA: AsmA family protein [Terracidiphilus sp.]|nr:AsmA family protein [Terracidiphilus sp.]